ncbi:MAG: DUF58 domain-containing protein [Oscillospiraceae bacterium]|nr:DUF58 domain-containing protein [Oscillospiraceae bacterium]
MIPAAIVAALLVVAALEYLSLNRAGRAVSAAVEADLPLCAPGEAVTLRWTVTNVSRLPLLYVGVSIYFDDDVTILEPEDWQKTHVVRDISGVHAELRLRLRPHSRRSGRLRFAIGRRGLHTLGKLYLETGDYLGVKSAVKTVEPKVRVICTADRAEPGEDTEPLGGLLGTRSVRRFLHEDPCLVAGYREYTGREPMKRIAWTQTARTGQWMVKQPDYTAEADVAVLLNMDGGVGPGMERCLALTRAVCETLEERKIPYLLRSNGDLRDAGRGLGRGHLFPILRGIGLSRLACYRSFSTLVDRCVAENAGERGFVVVTATPQDAQLRRLQAVSAQRLVVLTPEGVGA